ncbi:2-nitropropane dioxygenase NPD [Hyaloraphidium curvatum]|nr:2-nitropropane dioxygenase NPD [Hyaloraphidium curvatum]
MPKHSPPSRLRVREALNARLPIICAPMFLTTYPDLVKAACRAGVVGAIPALNARTEDILEEWLKEISADLEAARREGLRPADYAVNIVLRNNPRLKEQMRLMEKYRVPVIITIMGRANEVCDTVHSYGGLVFHDVTNLTHARIAVSDGVDGLVAVCAGAGGHAGPTSPFALIPSLRTAFPDVLIIAGGSISDGATVRAVQTLGADLAYLGTRFIATAEATADEGYKRMLVEAKSGPAPTFLPTVYTNKVSGLPANFLRDSLVRHGMNPDDPDSKLKSDGKAWKDIWSAGHGVLLIRDVPTVAELVDRLEREYRAAAEEERTRMGQWIPGGARM